MQQQQQQLTKRTKHERRLERNIRACVHGSDRLCSLYYFKRSEEEEREKSIKYALHLLLNIHRSFEHSDSYFSKEKCLCIRIGNEIDERD